MSAADQLRDRAAAALDRTPRRPRLTAAQEAMLRSIADGDQTFGGRVTDLASLCRRRLVHRIGPRYWLTAAGKALLARERPPPTH